MSSRKGKVFGRMLGSKDEYTIQMIEYLSGEVFHEFNVLDGYDFHRGAVCIRANGLVAKTNYQSKWSSERIAEMNKRLDREWLEEKLALIYERDQVLSQCEA